MDKPENLDKVFEAAYLYVDANKDSTLKLSNNDKLQFYALWKMAVAGECTSILY